MKLLIKEGIDILILEETKLDETFPGGQFYIDGFSPPFRKDRNRHGGGVMIYIRDDIHAMIIDSDLPKEIEGIFIELNFKNNKWLLLGTYRPPSQCSNFFYTEINKVLDKIAMNYDNLLFIGDFNETVKNTNTKLFMEKHVLNNLVKDYTCYKNPTNPSCIDLMLTNKKMSFKNSCVFDSGLSDFHRLIITSFRFKYSPGAPKQVFYRSFKHFNKHRFQKEFRQSIENDTEFDSFDKHFLNTLEKHAPLKQKTLRANDAPYMTNALRKAIMKRTELANKYHKTRQTEDYIKFRKHRNYVLRLYKRERKNYFNNLQKNDIEDNKLFWKMVKPLLSDKNNPHSKIKIVKDNRIIETDKEVAEEFNDKFSNVINDLNISFQWEPLVVTSEVDPILKAIAKYQNHPSILKIKENIPNPEIIEFKPISEEEVRGIISKFNTKKGTAFKSIPGKILKEYCADYYDIMTKIVNRSKQTNKFPNRLKLADINPAFKPGKKNRIDMDNYRPLSVLPYASKIFERDLKQQIQNAVENLLHNNLCGYREGFSAQHALISMLEKWKQCLDKKGFAGAVLMDLSKAFDCINYELLIAKLNAYGFSKNALELIHDYLTNRWQRTKVNGTFSEWSELLVGVPQGSVLGPVLFNIYLNDLLWIIDDCCNFADDTTLYACDKNLNKVIEKLEKNSKNAMQWFKENYMKMNSDKCKLLICGRTNHSIKIKVGDSEIEEESWVKLLGVYIDNKLNFDKHISKMVKKSNSKITVIQRSFAYLSQAKRKLLLNSFVQSQFSYAPLVWMLHSKSLTQKINKIHYKFLKTLYNDYDSTFEKLLLKEGTFTIHQINTQKLLI